MSTSGLPAHIGTEVPPDARRAQSTDWHQTGFFFGHMLQLAIDELLDHFHADRLGVIRSVSAEHFGQ